MLGQQFDQPVEADDNHERRRHPRRSVFKTALVFPILKEVGLSLENISQNGLSGICALNLSIRQPVHISFDHRCFLAAEVRWVNGKQCGLMLEDPLLLPNCAGPISPPPDLDLEPRATRIAVDLLATLVTSGPMLAGTIRNMSDEGMMIEIGGRVAEGERLLVRVKGQDSAIIGRVQWASGPMAGVFFEPVS